MGHPDQYNTDDHNTSNRKDAPKPDVQKGLAEDLGDEEMAKLEDAAKSGSSDYDEKTDRKRLGEAGHMYVGRQMDHDLQAHPRVEDEGDVRED